MKNIKYIFILLFSNVFCETPEITPILKKFVKEYDQYYPHPNWLVKEFFLKMNIQEFELAFEYLVSNLYRRSSRWFYLYDNPRSFKDDSIDREQILEHFNIFTNLFSKIGVDPNSGYFHLFEKAVPAGAALKFDGCKYTGLADYLKMNNDQSLYGFFALYYKYLVGFLYDKCKEYSALSNNDEVKKEIGDAYSILEKIFTNYLIGSRYEMEALRQLDRYELIVSLTHVY